jgi:predicted SprT family Zn-dependent metalloprotease
MRPLPSADEMREEAVSLLTAVNALKLAKRLRIEWNARMHSTVGRADYRCSLILLNPALQRFGRSEIDRTLRHELAHLLAQFRTGRRRISPHGAEWRQACCDLGIEGERACHKLPVAVRHISPRFLYWCANCQREFPRVRRIRRATACLICCRKFSDGKYDERFRLHLANSSRRGSFSGVFSESSQ